MTPWNKLHTWPMLTSKWQARTLADATNIIRWHSELSNVLAILMALGLRTMVGFSSRVKIHCGGRDTPKDHFLFHGRLAPQAETKFYKLAGGRSGGHQGPKSRLNNPLLDIEVHDGAVLRKKPWRGQSLPEIVSIPSKHGCRFLKASRGRH